jgi:hypothetical protein
VFSGSEGFELLGDGQDEKQNEQIDLRFTGSGDGRVTGNRVQCLSSLGQLIEGSGFSLPMKLNQRRTQYEPTQETCDCAASTVGSHIGA